jgi:hypothetical protein
MVTKFKIFEGVASWTIDKIKDQLGMFKESEVINPMDIKYSNDTKELHDSIVQYFCWKNNTKHCLINYFFCNSGAKFGVKFLDENGNSYLPMYNENEPELVHFINDPDFFKETNKFNL